MESKAPNNAALNAVVGWFSTAIVTKKASKSNTFLEIWVGKM
jgi:hypothetical protein